MLVCYLSPRWALSSTTSGQDVPGQEGDDDDRRRDSDDGDCGGGYDHSAILASLSGVESRRWWDGQVVIHVTFTNRSVDGLFGGRLGEVR